MRDERNKREQSEYKIRLRFPSLRFGNDSGSAERDKRK